MCVCVCACVCMCVCVCGHKVSSSASSVRKHYYEDQAGTIPDDLLLS